MESNVRAHVIVSGTVQGVFFRMETQRAAESRGVNGWVRNKADGTVEAVFEGPKDRVTSVLDWCRQGPPRATVDKVDVSWEDYTGEYKGFRVTY